MTVAGGEAITDADDEGCPGQLVSPGTDERTLKTRGRCSGALFLNTARALKPARLTDSHCLYHATIGIMIMTVAGIMIVMIIMNSNNDI